jgi:hypothetical protein
MQVSNKPTKKMSHKTKLQSRFKQHTLHHGISSCIAAAQSYSTYCDAVLSHKMLFWAMAAEALHALNPRSCHEVAKGTSHGRIGRRLKQNVGEQCTQTAWTGCWHGFGVFDEKGWLAAVAHMIREIPDWPTEIQL